MVKAAEPYSAALRWLASGQYTVVGHAAAYCYAAVAACGEPALRPSNESITSFSLVTLISI